MVELRDYIESINITKDNLLNEDRHMLTCVEAERDYPKYAMNTIYSRFADTVMLVNDINMFTINSNRMCYDYLLHTVRSKRRFAKGDKVVKNPDVEILMEYYNINRLKAEEYLAIITKEQLKKIKGFLFTGGLKK